MMLKYKTKRCNFNNMDNYKKNASKVIYSALAFYENGEARKFELKGVGLMNSREIYLRNAFISLISAKKYSDEDTDILLIVNVELPSIWLERFKNEGIKIEICPFNDYRFIGYYWELAFYKLCALKYMLTFDYEYYIQVDSDTIFIRDTNLIFDEAKEDSLLLYEIPYGLNNSMRKLINSDYYLFTGKNKIISQWGGEFYASNKKNLCKFYDKINLYYNKYLLLENKAKRIGDEYFLSLAACDMTNVRNATPYVSRELTRGMYRASTRYADSECVILHLILEKPYGLNYIYSYYSRHHKLPTMAKIAKICNLPKLKGYSINRYMVYVLLSSILNKIFKRKY